MSAAPRLLIRADAGPEIGLGHVTRCLALGQACVRAGGTVLVLTRALPVSIQRRFELEGIRVILLGIGTSGTDSDAKQTATLCKHESCTWIVVDGYCFGPEYQSSLKQSDARLLLIDDIGNAGPYCADLILNQNVFATEAMYARKESHTKVLLGPRYVLLRDEFRKWLERERPIPAEGTKVLVAMGGADPAGLTRTVIAALRELQSSDLQVRIVVGAENRKLSQIQAEAAESGFVVETDVEDISRAMAWADLAISAAGTTVWELAYMGVPSVLLVAAENQRPTAEELDRRGSTVYVRGTSSTLTFDICREVGSLLLDSERRAKMARAGHELVDGKGAARVIEALTELRLRPAAAGDSRAVWEVANETSVRAASFSGKPIELVNHEAWFRAKIEDRNCALYVIENGTGHLGQVRFDIANGEAVLSIALRAGCRGRGIGTWALTASCKSFFSSHGTARVHAFIRMGNEASFRSFAKAGFREVGETIVCDQPARHFVMDRS
jgi:UDP-2,4-diacetamido-2,4,6-trideoxy-beta-L-altropyranose hydrolase